MASLLLYELLEAWKPSQTCEISELYIATADFKRQDLSWWWLKLLRKWRRLTCLRVRVQMSLEIWVSDLRYKRLLRSHRLLAGHWLPQPGGCWTWISYGRRHLQRWLHILLLLCDVIVLPDHYPLVHGPAPGCIALALICSLTGLQAFPVRWGMALHLEHRDFIASVLCLVQRADLGIGADIVGASKYLGALAACGSCEVSLRKMQRRRGKGSIDLGRSLSVWSILLTRRILRSWGSQVQIGVAVLLFAFAKRFQVLSRISVVDWSVLLGAWPRWIAFGVSVLQVVRQRPILNWIDIWNIMIERMRVIYHIAWTTCLNGVRNLTACKLLGLWSCFSWVWMAIDRVQSLCLIVGAGTNS